MSNSNCQPGVLATDLDGTLIPLPNEPQNQRDLVTLRSAIETHNLTLTFVTGRHLASVRRAIEDHDLPPPDWVICDVGSTVVRRIDEGHFEVDSAYQDHLSDVSRGVLLADVAPHIEALATAHDAWQLRRQESEKQGLFKLSYYCDHQHLTDVTDAIRKQLSTLDAPFSVIASVDPFNQDGLIDILPQNVSKAYALEWWSANRVDARQQLVFAGDSGNDTAAMIAGYRTIVVGNADRQLARHVASVHQQRGWENRLYLARRAATSGVLCGCRWFGLLPDDA